MSGVDLDDVFSICRLASGERDQRIEQLVRDRILLCIIAINVKQRIEMPIAPRLRPAGNLRRSPTDVGQA
ncbi:MAG TPA: hypothetical protein VJ396_08440 [Acidiferrobacterales bacterium]|nr:hypothetical protein [Acidiferrobacterales bacterium]